jgi:hypothetical protein
MSECDMSAGELFVVTQRLDCGHVGDVRLLTSPSSRSELS